MKKQFLTVCVVLALAGQAFAGQAFAGQAEVQACLEKTAEVKAVLTGEKTDPVLTGYLALLPDLADQVELDMANPYRCSLEG